MYVYILTNKSQHPFYTGVAKSVRKRLWEHKNGIKCEYTSRYRMNVLVYCEHWQSPKRAIAREKQIKGLTRAKKIQLIVSMNPEWKDLSDGWYDDVVWEFREPVDPSAKGGPQDDGRKAKPVGSSAGASAASG